MFKESTIPILGINPDGPEYEKLHRCNIHIQTLKHWAYEFLYMYNLSPIQIIKFRRLLVIQIRTTYTSPTLTCPLSNRHVWLVCRYSTSK